MFGFSIFKILFTVSIVFMVLWIFKLLKKNRSNKSKEYRYINTSTCNLCGVFFSDTDIKTCNRLDCPGN